MEVTTGFHDRVPNAISQETNGVFHDAVAFHPTNRGFNPNADGRHGTIRLLLRRGQGSSRWGCLGLDDRDAREEQSLEAFRVIQVAAGWHAVTCSLGDGLI
jgi:hypothetical protein